MYYLKEIKNLDRQGGAAMLVSVVFFLFLSLAVTSGLVSPSVRGFKSADNQVKSSQSLYLAESAVEDAYFRLKTGKDIGGTNIIELNGNSGSATIADSGYNQKTVSAVGDVSNRQRTTQLVLNTGTGASFNFGVQSGTGGIDLRSNSVINGSVYSNGIITGTGTITGSATSANSASLTADQTNDILPPAYDVTFGNASGSQDFAQSFQVSSTGQINKVELYLKKVSTPSNLTVRIVNDASGNPGTTTITSRSLSASLVSATYNWVSLPFSSNPELTAGVTYWLVLDGATNSSKYYTIGGNSNGYPSGLGKVGQYSGTWNNTSPSGLDGFFRLYLGGVTGLIDGITVGSGGVGNAYAHTVNNSNIAGTNYCQTGTGNNKSCDTSLADPVQTPMPISDQNVLDWKSEAEAGGTHTGDYTIANGESMSLGPQKVVGNLLVDNGGHLTITGTLWVTGTITIKNNSTVNLSASYSSSEGLIIADGKILIDNNTTFSGSGVPGSYIMALSTWPSTSAIELHNNGGAVILYAAYGEVELENNATAKALNGKWIELNNNSVVTYETGLADLNFVNGPSGGWSISSWKETE